MPHVRIEVIEGRTPAEKRALLDAVHEPPMENWGVHGGRPASEVEIGYDLNV